MSGSTSTAVPLNGASEEAPGPARNGPTRIRVKSLERTFMSGTEEVRALGPSTSR